ncbi:hypothetical protein BJ138DRAFT_1129381 [Hygrophoropsis aurantiaca]|uniref:Uncharacterized protein n=1 Tax=Hygrophoropsis aurantiaca TaxID=72124 RepID=A0ACB8A1F4_9AGAM|nr:hypothetical protein BJ138DRAFT_1129381 [Hygrophoropsis aurantiaca]
MPAAVPSLAAPSDAKATSSKSRPQQSSRKVRVVRRRGRANGHFESDDEFEREIGTDSESDNDDHSTVDSVTDSDTEPASEDVLSNDHSHILTPDTTQGSGDASVRRGASKPTLNDPAPFFSATGNWSEMVTEENANGPADLPVIEFAEFDDHSMDQKSLPGKTTRKQTKPAKRLPVKRAASAPESDSPRPQLTLLEAEDQDQPTDDPSHASTSQPRRGSFVRRPPGQSARQAYQQRLEADPSYVPTVGEFWGHDDRLLDKDLRSLSGWWRGRWQGRGRGRGGFDRGFVRGRGRGGFSGPESVQRAFPQDVADPQDAAKTDTDAPPIDQAWTHDGFEEMKRRDEKRRALQQQQPQQQQQQRQQQTRPARGFTPFRGRGGFSPRGRGGFGRGLSTATVSAGSQEAASSTGRIWYAMKPERVWTKQHEAFLYFDSTLKPRPGHGPGYRVRLSDRDIRVVRGPPKSAAAVAQVSAETSSSRAPLSEDGDRAYVVRIPKSASKDKGAEAAVVIAESVTTVEEPPIEDVFTVRPGLVPRVSILESQPPAPSANVHDHTAPAPASAEQPAKPGESSSSISPPVSTASPTKTTSPLLDQLMREAAEHQSQEVPTGVVWGQQENPSTALFQADSEPPNRRVLPTVPPLQTVFSPPPQPSPPYGSPYGYGSPLPPGIMMNQHGMPYEIATGRPVYLQAPPTMYTPRPLAHGMMTPPGLPFVPGHMHHPSTGSPDFLAPPHTPPVNGFIDPATGGPIFSFPRQSSRIEIRPPSAQADGKPATKTVRRPSGLRTSAAPFEPSRPSSPSNQTYYADNSNSSTTNPYQASEATHNGEASQYMPDPSMNHSMMPYSSYQQQYYYPEQYGYPQYYDMSQTPQYEMYPADPHAQHQPVYY